MDQSTAVHLFTSYWWLIFPIGWMVAGVFGSLFHYRHKSDMLNLIKTYAEKGQEPPAALLDALKSDESRAYDDRYYGRRWRRRRHGWWWQVVVFASLSAGFGYFGQYGGGPAYFSALALAFGVAATALTVIGVIQAVTTPRLDPRDRDEYRD
jgi:hypothetical protein